MSPDIASILSQIKTLEAQLNALKVQVEKLSARDEMQPHSFADLYGRFPELQGVSDEDIEASLYSMPEKLEELD